MSNNQSGFTLIELLVVVSIAVILATIAVPGLQGFMNSNRVTSTANGISAALQTARSEAIKRGLRAVVCRKSSAGNTCAAGSGSWNDGWLLFVDANNNDLYDAASDTLIRVESGLPGSTRINPIPIELAAITYLPSGATAHTTTAREFNVCHLNFVGTNKGRKVDINATGRPAVSSVTISSCT